MEDDRDRFPWGCSCGRLCLPEDDECEACGGQFSADKLIRSEAAKKRFLKRHEKTDRRALEGVGAVLESVEASYRAAERQFERHAYPEMRLDGVVAQDKAGTAMFGNGIYSDPFDAFYGDADVDPWLWG